VDRFRAGLGQVGPYLPVVAYGLIVVAAAVGLLAQRSSRSSALRERFRPWEWLVAPAALVTSTFAYLTSLASTWRTSGGLGTAIGGIVPWGDANLYFGGAERLLFFGHLDAYNSRHPLDALYLADRLALTNLNLRGALILQAVLLGVASYLAARALARDFGIAAGIAVFAAIFGFAHYFTATTMTEPVGLLFGALALAAMWHAIRIRDARLALAGLALLAVGLAAREGPLLLLVALPVWFAWYLRGTGRLNWRFLGVAAVIAVAGLALNYVVVPVFGGYSGNVNGNSGQLLYGMAKGYPGWDVNHPSWVRVYVDYPQLRGLPDQQINQFVQRKAREAVVANPLRFSIAVLRSAKNYVLLAKDDIVSPVHGNGLRWFVYIAMAALAAVVLVRRWRSSRWHVVLDATLFAGVVLAVPVLIDLWPTTDHRPTWIGGAIALVGFVGLLVRGTDHLGNPPQLTFGAAAFLGFVASMPVLGVDNVRVFATSVPFVALPFVIAVAAICRRAPLTVPDRQPTRRTLSVTAPAWVGAGIVAAMFLGTPIAMAAIKRPALPSRRCPNGQEAQPLIGGVAVRVVGRQAQSQRHLEDVGITDYVSDSVIYAPITGLLDSIQPPTTVIAGLTRNGNDRIAFVPGTASAPQHSVLYLCGHTVHDAQAQLLLQFWPQPFDFFSGTVLPTAAGTSGSTSHR
jgi:hypothetical protein